MGRILTEEELQGENLAFAGTGGISANNRDKGFHPAFLDTDTHAVYLARFLDGRLAPFHILDGLPDEVVVARGEYGRVEAVRPGVVSGFVCEGAFYTREEAAQRVAEH